MAMKAPRTKKTSRTGMATTKGSAGKSSKMIKRKSLPKAAPKKSKKRRRASALRIQTQHVDFLTYKVDQLRKFYGEILELETETRDTEGLNYLIVRTSESSTIGFMPPHPDMHGEQPLPREPTFYFVVKDVETAYAQLIAKGAAFMVPPQEMPWGYRVVTTTDPEGRSIMLASKVRKKTS